FEFVIRSTLASFDLDTVEGRVGALRAAAPVVAGIRDAALRPEYARMLSGWLGMELEAVRRAVSNAPRSAQGAPSPRRDGREPAPEVEDSVFTLPDGRDPVVRLATQAVETLP